MTPTDPAPPLWAAIEHWRPRRGIHIEQVANFRTRQKIKQGLEVRGDVLENIDRVLGWMPGDAKRAWSEGVPPRPVEGDDGGAMAVRVEVMRNLGSAITASGTATDQALRQARRLAEEILRTLRADNS